MRVRLCLLFACVSLPAFAQPTVKQEPDRTVVRQRTHVVFSETEVPGTASGPNGGTITVRPRARRFESLLKVRADFQKELQESAGSL